MTTPARDDTGRTRVLVVEDEDAIRNVIVAYLEREGFWVQQACDGPSAVESVERQRPDVIVLDLMLPGFDGVEVCRRIRIFSDAYVIMLTARVDEVDTLIGLSVGADDYITKPFSNRELIARIHVMLRRPRQSTSRVRRFGDLVIDLDAREVTLAAAKIELTRTEFDVLAALAERPRQVLSRGALVAEVWGPGWVGDERLADVHVSHIRAKLADDATDPRYITTVRGIGFRMGTG